MLLIFRKKNNVQTLKSNIFLGKKMLYPQNNLESTHQKLFRFSTKLLKLCSGEVMKKLKIGHCEQNEKPLINPKSSFFF